MVDDSSEWSRRRLLQWGAVACVGAALSRHTRAADPAGEPLITKTIPSTGERLPVIGIGTNSFREASYADLRALLQRMQALGGTVIDTAPSYGESEGVIGRALAESSLRDRVFISTKLNAKGKGWGTAGQRH